LTKEVFKILFDNHFDQVRRHIYYRCGDSELSTDIGQETFMRIWDKQMIPEKGKELALFYKIATNLLISRKRRDQTAMTYRQSLIIRQESETPAEQLEYKEAKHKYEQALIKLSDKQREVFLMSRVEDLSYKEISEQLGISVKAVEKRMSQTLVILREALL